MRVLVTGSSGLVGSALVPALGTRGHRVQRLVRSPPRPGEDEAHWDPHQGTVDREAIEGAGAAVHLAGENIAAGRWTAGRKARIRESRVRSTRLLAETLAGLASPPAVLVSASAVGYYGDRGGEVLTEESAPGSGFLAEVCRQWEEATRAAAEAGIRVVNLRIGIVLSPRGGALARMLFPFRLGAGGVVGPGTQYMSWIAIDDLIAAILHALEASDLEGPVNAVAPRPVTNREFTRTLARVLSRPALVPLPARLAQLLLGEMARELLLASACVEPGRLTETGFAWSYPEFEGALRHLLGR